MNRLADLPPPPRKARVVEAFLAPAIVSEGGEPLTRARVLVWISLIVAATLLGVAAPSNFAYDQPLIALVMLVAGLLALAAPLLLRVSGSLPLSATALVGVIWLSMVVLDLGSSDIISSSLYSMAALPLAATLLGGPRAGRAWLAIVFLTVIGIHLVGVHDITVPIPAMTPQSEIELFIMRDVLMLTTAIAIVGIYYDVQRRNAVIEAGNARSRAEQSEARFERAFASNPDAVAIWGLEDDVVIECNDGFLRLLGLPRNRVLGRIRWCEAFGIEEADRAKLLQAISASEAGHAFEATTRGGAQGTDVGARVHLVSATLVEIDDQPCVLATARDITRQRKLDEHLRQSQKMEAVGQLAGSVAHDFNNMLTVILGYGSELKETLHGADAEKIGRIDGAARRASALTRQLLAFSRRDVVQPRAVEINAAIRSLSSMLERLLGSNIELRLDLDAHEIHVLADPGQLDQALVNLAINGRDAINGRGVITIHTERDASAPEHAIASPTDGPAPAWCAIRVSDDGCGMDEETLSRALEPFFTTKPRGAGTGLGLSTAHGMLGHVGATLQLDSRVGRGTTASIHLPCIDGPRENRGDDAQPGPDVATSASTILLVEDEELVRQLAHRMLERAGHSVVAAENGTEALELARQRGAPFDLVVTDVVMPGMNGLLLARALAAEWSDVPILFISGYTDPSFAGSTELPDGAEFLSKPFTGAALVERVNGLLRAREQA